MALTGEVISEATPLSLYIELIPGTRAEIEVVSRAAIAWSKMIHEAVFLIEPFAEVRVELVSGTEGSINLNSLINAVRGVVNDPKKLKAVAYGLMLFFSGQIKDWVIGKALDSAWSSASTEIAQIWHSLTEVEKEDVGKIVTLVVQSKATQDKARRVYAELSRDDRVTGVGVSLIPGRRPADIVPRSDFALRAGEQTEVIENIQRRIVPDRVTLLLLSPSLSADDLKWKFSLSGKTVWAHMDDADMRARIMPGSNSPPHMLAGIEMDVDLETTQEFRDGVWVITDQRVVKVHSLREPPSQPDWFNSPTEND